jgi:ribosomal protein S25
VTARIGDPVADRDSASDTYRDSLAAGSPLSSRALADRFGISQSTASRIIREVRAESAAA